jgi:hypothetical protein
MDTKHLLLNEALHEAVLVFAGLVILALVLSTISASAALHSGAVVQVSAEIPRCLVLEQDAGNLTVRTNIPVQVQTLTADGVWENHRIDRGGVYEFRNLTGFSVTAH